MNYTPSFIFNMFEIEPSSKEITVLHLPYKDNIVKKINACTQSYVAYYMRENFEVLGYMHQAGIYVASIYKETVLDEFLEEYNSDSECNIYDKVPSIDKKEVKIITKYSSRGFLVSKFLNNAVEKIAKRNEILENKIGKIRVCQKDSVINEIAKGNNLILDLHKEDFIDVRKCYDLWNQHIWSETSQAVFLIVDFLYRTFQERRVKKIISFMEKNNRNINELIGIPVRLKDEEEQTSYICIIKSINGNNFNLSCYDKIQENEINKSITKDNEFLSIDTSRKKGRDFYYNLFPQLISLDNQIRNLSRAHISKLFPKIIEGIQNFIIPELYEKIKLSGVRYNVKTAPYSLEINRW